MEELLKNAKSDIGYLYRYSILSVSKLGERIYTADLFLEEYPIISLTKMGYWINDFGQKKWVSNYSKKRFAHPTKKEAAIGFQKRSERREKILKGHLNITKAGLDEINHLIKKDEF